MRPNSKQKDLKMMRQASYRSLPTVSDFHNKHSIEKGAHGEKEMPELETSVDLESLVEDEDTIALCKEPYNFPLHSTSDMGDKKQFEREKIATFKNLSKGSGAYFSHAMTDMGNSKDSDHDSWYGDEDLSCGSLEYDTDDDDSRHDSIEGDVLNLGNSNLSAIIDDFIKDDYFSSSEEEEEYFIEEKHGLRNDRLQLYKAYSEPVMTISHYSLHTIDEEESDFNDDCSFQSKGLDRAVEQNITKQFSISHGKSIAFQRSRSAPTPSNQYENEFHNQEGHIYVNQGQNEGVSLELLRCFSKESRVSGTRSETSSNNQQSIQADIETQEIQGEHGVSKSSVRRNFFQNTLSLSLILFVLMIILFVMYLTLS